MRKLNFLLLSLYLMVSSPYAAKVNLLCPDGTRMQQSRQCAPDAGCWPVGVYVITDDGSSKANIDNDGSIPIDDKYLGKLVKIQSHDNFWAPRYCPRLGAGYLVSSFHLQPKQTVTMNFLPNSHAVM